MSLVLEKRESSSPLVNFLVPVLSVLFALLLGALIIYLSGFDPGVAYMEMLSGAFGSGYAISETIVKAIPLMLCALGVGLAFKTVLWNIGAEGQLYMGAWAAGWVALSFPQGQSWWLIPLMMIAGFLAGALWGLVPGILKASLNVNEIITSLLLNYVAILWVDYFVYGPWKDPKGYGFPFTPFFGEGAWLPTFFGTRVHLGIVFALFAAIIIYFLLKSTRLGYEIRVIGENPRAAKYAGMNIFRNIIIVFIISGGLAGLAGMAEVSGVIHRLQHAISPGYGYTAIIIAWLSRLNPITTVLVAILFGGLLVGGFSVRSIGLSESLVYVIQGIILFLLLAGDILTRYRLSWRGRS
ncbi:MAG: ABC transporter permease [bacterium]|jgi:simple sugar transport system permease protein|nr:ABC transporter permease [Caldisericota bacterium]